MRIVALQVLQYPQPSNILYVWHFAYALLIVVNMNGGYASNKCDPVESRIFKYGLPDEFAALKCSSLPVYCEMK